MTRLTAIARLLARDAFMVLATLAIALKIMIPAGYMPGMEARNGLPFALVLCTGDGAKIVQPGQNLASHKGDAPADKSSHESCPFAAHGATAPPPAIATTAAIQLAAYVLPPASPARTIAPGRGLAAPPPPPTGPPAALI